MAEPICAIGECTKPARARQGMCYMHYSRWRRYRDPLTVKRIFGDDQARFWSKVSKTETCWLWIGALQGMGYGEFHMGGVAGTNYLAHRIAYQWLVGPIPDGLDLDHLCRVTRCVNPAHLEPVTHVENMRRGEIWARRWPGSAAKTS